jgi:tetratricopeptide (TPR) repeat protein
MRDDFADLARQALKGAGYSMRAACRAMNYDPSYLSRVLNNKQRPSVELATALDALVGGDGKLVELVVGLTEDDRGRVSRSLDKPSQVDGGTVEAFRGVLAAQRRLEDSIGAGPVIPAAMAQLESLSVLARESRGKNRAGILSVAAEWYQFAGWLHAAEREDDRALRLLSTAEEVADEAGDGAVAAVAVSFKGYVARQRGNYLGVVRSSQAALHSPGAHATQQVFDTMQAATGYAGLNEREKARRLLDQAAHAAQECGDPPEIVYWYGAPFFHMNIGMVSVSLGDFAEAAGYLAQGLAGIPVEQRGAKWLDEYREALAMARSRA